MFGRLARCFLNGLPTFDSADISFPSVEDGAFRDAEEGADDSAVPLRDGSCSDGVPGEPVVMGLFDVDCFRAGSFKGSAECCRFNWELSV